MMQPFQRSMAAAAVATTLLLLGAGCGEKASPNVTAATQPDAAATPKSHRVNATKAPVKVAAAPWRRDAVSAEASDPTHALTLLDAILTDGLLPHTDADQGISWFAATADAATWRKAADLTAVAPGFLSTLTDARATARCAGSWCLLSAGQRHLVVKMRPKGLTRLIVTGVYELGERGLLPHYANWLQTLQAAWREPADNALGLALSLEEEEEHGKAIEALERAIARDPGNPWPFYYRARMRALQLDYKRAFIDLKRVHTFDDPTAVSALLLGSTDATLKRLREHTAMDAVFAEMALGAPTDPIVFGAYLCRFRGAPVRLQQAVGRQDGDPEDDVGGPPSWVRLSAFLEAACLVTPTVEKPLTLVWTDPRGLSLKATLTRLPAGTLHLVSITDSDDSDGSE